MSVTRHPPRPLVTAVASGSSLTAAILILGMVALAALATRPALPGSVGGRDDVTVKLAAPAPGLDDAERAAIPADDAPGGASAPVAGVELPRPDSGSPA